MVLLAATSCSLQKQPCLIHLLNSPWCISRPVSGDGVIDLSLEFGEMVDPSKESNKYGSGHCTKMQAILRQVSDGECVGLDLRRVKEI